MTHEEKKMKPIWFLVGLMLLVNGALILSAGIYYFFSPNQYRTVLSELHPSIWWGGIMVVVGALYVIANRRATVE